MARPTSSIVIAEPHEACRRMLEHLIGGQMPDLSVVASSGRPEAAAHLATSSGADIVVVWVDGDGYDRVSAIKNAAENVRVVVLADHPDGEAVFDGLRAGATAFLGEGAAPEDILVAIDRAARGETTVDAALVTEGIRWAASEAETSVDDVPLTHREAEVIDLLVTGVPPGTIAAMLFISRRTVESHLSSVYRKLGVRGRIEALRAYERYVKRIPMRALNHAKS